MDISGWFINHTSWLLPECDFCDAPKWGITKMHRSLTDCAFVIEKKQELGAYTKYQKYNK